MADTPIVPIVDLEYVKERLNVPASISDEKIQQMIDEIEAAIREHCNNPYLEGLPLSYRRNVVKMIEFDLNRKEGYTSETLSRHSVSYATDYPPDILRGLKRRLTW